MVIKRLRLSTVLSLLLVLCPPSSSYQRLYELIDETDDSSSSSNDERDHRSLETSDSSSMQERLYFNVMGDVPYLPREWENLPNQIKGMNVGADFTVHVGDLKKRDFDCKLTDYTDFSEIMKKSSSPVFLLPGDNDWYECNDKMEALSMWISEFEHFAQNHWGIPSFEDSHTHQEYNWAFSYKDVFVIGLHVIHASFTEEPMLYQIVEDATNFFNSHAAQMARAKAVVIFGHTMPVHSKYKSLKEAIEIKVESMSNKPFLYIQGETHSFIADQPWDHAKNFLRIVVDKGGIADPLEVAVDPGGDVPFKIKRRALRPFVS